jgi:hypothetical protein
VTMKGNGDADEGRERVRRSECRGITGL